MLNYIITIAISAFFVPHYLSIFWSPLKQNPWDVIVGARSSWCCWWRVNIVGVKEAAKLNIVLAVVDFATQALLVLLGFVLIFSPTILVDNVDFGVAPTWARFFLAIPVAMIAYTGHRDDLEPRRGGARPLARHPALDPPGGDRGLRDLLHAAGDRALGAPGDARARTATPPRWAFRPRTAASPTTRSSGWWTTWASRAITLDALEIYVGVLAATILFIAANAGVIGASRITYSMASYRQLPEPLPAAPPALQDARGSRWCCSRACASIIALLPGQTDFLGTMYSFGAMLSFTIAHVSIVALRVRRRDEELVYRARPNLRLRGVDWPLFAIVGGLATGLAWLVVVVQEPAHALGRPRLARARLRGLRRSTAGACCSCRCARRCAPRRWCSGPSLQIEYRSIVVPVTRSAESEEALRHGGAPGGRAARRGWRSSTCSRSRWSCR